MFDRPPPSPHPQSTGYYVRHAVYTDTVASFLAATSGRPRQIVSLGAGFDTRPFRLAAASPATPPVTRYLELDVADVVARKAGIVAAAPDLAAAVGLEVGDAGAPLPATIHTAWYSLLSADLRSPDSVTAALTAAGIDGAHPTLILAECVFIYLPPSSASALTSRLASFFTDAAMLLFEQVHPHDPFGRMMVANVAARGCPLLGLAATPTLAAHERRFTDSGWASAAAVTMAAAYDGWLDAGDRARANATARLDEVEEWRLLLDHYAFVTAATRADGEVAAAVVRR